MDEVLHHRARGLAKSYGERLRGCNVRDMDPEKAEGLSPELQTGSGGVAVGHRRAERTHCGVQRPDRSAGRNELSASGVAEADQGSGHADRADLLTDAGRSTSLRQEPRCGRLSGTAAGTQELGRERAAAAHWLCKGS